MQTWHIYLCVYSACSHPTMNLVCGMSAVPAQRYQQLDSPFTGQSYSSHRPTQKTQPDQNPHPSRRSSRKQKNRVVSLSSVMRGVLRACVHRFRLRRRGSPSATKLSFQLRRLACCRRGPSYCCRPPLVCPDWPLPKQHTLAQPQQGISKRSLHVPPIKSHPRPSSPTVPPCQRRHPSIAITNICKVKRTSKGQKKKAKKVSTKPGDDHKRYLCRRPPTWRQTTGEKDKGKTPTSPDQGL